MPSKILFGEPPNEYPTKEAYPIAEDDHAFAQMIDTDYALRAFFRAVPSTLVAFKLLIYYAHGDYMLFFMPDIFVAHDLLEKKRDAYNTWEEGKAPDVLISFATDEFKRDDFRYYRETYAELGVREYFVVDPRGEYLGARLRGYRLVDEEYVRLNDEPLLSEALGLELRAENDQLRLYDPKRGEYLLFPDELQLEIEQERLRAELLSQENARLRAELERLTGQS